MDGARCLEYLAERAVIRVRALLEAMTPDYPAMTVLRCGVSRNALAWGMAHNGL